ncbi:MAG: hypothetical protein OEZ06_20305 [Myxococcales bacterium]|nr:hypothetical protein [Myxococcales bacterium]
MTDAGAHPSGDANTAETCADVDCSALDSECTVGACSPTTGECVADPLSAGTACGDSSDTECSAPDSCDGAGACLANHATSGASCGDTGDECTVADTCDGAGSCTDNGFVTAGTSCGDSSDTECSAPDSCDGAGACLTHHVTAGASCGDAGDECTVADACDGAGSCTDNGFVTAGTSCGDSSDTECSAPDSCDGAGACLANHATSGASCGDAGDECTVADTCDGAGSCTDNGFLTAGTSCGDASDTECSAPDSCDGAGACLANHATSGASCGDAGDECTVADACDGAGSCTDNGFVTAGTSCGDSSDTECSAPDSCDGAGACLANHATAGTGCGDASDTQCTDTDSCDGSGSCLANHVADGSACSDCADPGGCDGCDMGSCTDLGCTEFASAGGYTGCEALPKLTRCPDISATGAGLSLTGDGAEDVAVGFNFKFYEATYTTVSVSANGAISLGSGGSVGATNQALASHTQGVPIIAALWDDLDPAAAGAQVYWELMGTAPERSLVVQWQAPHATGSDPVDARAVLYENEGTIEVCYVDAGMGNAALDSGASATSGVARYDASSALQYSHDSANLADGLFLRYERGSFLSADWEGVPSGTSIVGMDGWTSWIGLSGSGTVSSDQAANGSNSGYLSVTGIANDTFPPITSGRVTIEANVYLTDTTGFYFFVCDTENASTCVYDQYFELWGDLGGYPVSAAGALTVGSWVLAQMTFDFDAGTLSQSYNGVTVGSGSTTMTGLRTVAFYGEDAYLDDVRVYVP